MQNQLFQYTHESAVTHSEFMKKNYYENGILHFKNFLSKHELYMLKNEINIIEADALQDFKTHWHDDPTYFYSFNAMQSTQNKDFAAKEYFLKSQHRAHVFFEYNQPIINRIGHGMHLVEKYACLQNIIYNKTILKKLLILTGLIRPICHLSVYIPKYPKKLGSEVNPHQEGTFAYTEPTSVVVLWIALEDANLSNACMWGILGSNHWPLKYVSLVDHDKRIRHFKQINNVQVPNFNEDRSAYTPLIAEAGDAFIFHGHFIHCSPVNHGKYSRKAISMQFIDTVDVFYPEHNWITAPNYKYLYNLSTDHKK